jgi:NADH-quinone oxidoreductase subunit J
MVMVFGFISLLFSLLVISEKNTMFSVFYLVGTFTSMACLLLALKIDYLGLLLIIVYVGAIVILFLFVVMMINIKLEDSSRSQFTPIGIIIILIMILEVYTNYYLVPEVLPGELYSLQINGKIPNIESLGLIMYF